MGINVKKGGFSIVEIMVSLLLVSIALITMVAVFPKIAGHKKVIREVDEAYSIAIHMLDSLQHQSHHSSITSGDTLPTVTRSFTTFSSNYTLVNSGTPLKTATVTVQWSKAGKSHEISLAGVVR